MSQTPPYFPFYPTDFAASGTVEAMTTEEVGAYILLLCKAWHETPPCSIPDDDRILARWTRLGDDGWTRCRSTVRACFVLRDGRLYNPRLDREWRKLFEYRRSQSENGKKGAAVKHRQSGAMAVPQHPYPPPSPELNQNPTQRVPVSDIADMAEVDRAVRTLRVSALVRGRVGKLGGLTVKEIADTFAAVKRDALDPETQPPIRDVDATVAHRLLAARGEAMPTKKAGNLSGPLSGAINENGLEGLMNIRRSRMGRTA